MRIRPRNPLRGAALRRLVTLPGVVVLVALAGGIALAATVARGPSTSPARTVDTTPPPAPQITQAPPSLSASRTAKLAFTDAEGGARFLCKLDVGSGGFSSCSSPKTYSDLSQGAHSFSVEARDAAGNTSSAVSVSWTVDTIPPPKPTISGHPSDPSSSASATFTFGDREAGARFECRLDGASWTTCTSPATYNGLAAAEHHFRVRAFDAAGNRSDDVDFEWKVTQSSGKAFTISGGFAGTLSPGRSGPLALTVTNPNSAAIVVTSLVVTIQPGSTKPGCDGPTNLQVTQSNVSATNTLSVPAGGHVTLPAGGVSAPQLLMRDLATSQDACKGAAFTFGYSGSAHS
jgi:hypothetical protein